MVKRTTDFQHQIADTCLEQTAGVFDHPTPFDPAVDRLAAHAAAGAGRMRPVLLHAPLLTTGVLRGPQDGDLRERARQKTAILHKLTPCGSGRRWRLGEACVLDAPCRGRAQHEEGAGGLEPQESCERVARLLAARTARLCTRVLGADQTPCRPILGTRGDASTTADSTGATSDATATGPGSATTGSRAAARAATRVAAAAAETPHRGASAVRERAGAAPRVRSAASNAGQRTCLPCWAVL